MKNFLKISIFITLIALPFVSSAQTTVNCRLTDFTSVAVCAKSLMTVTIYLLMSFAVVYTIYGSVRFIGAEGSDREKWRQVMIYGIIGLFVITSIWGLVSILTGTFGFQSNTQISPPPFSTTQ